MTLVRRLLLVGIALAAAMAGATCAETDPNTDICDPDSYKCTSTTLLRCNASGTGYAVVEDCDKRDKICTERGCRVCVPEQTVCFGAKLLRCNSEGNGYLAKPIRVCDVNKGEVCDLEVGCINACKLAARNRSYVGCEYWPVDLDNAVVSIGKAAAQQFAVALSNPSTLPAKVKVWKSDAAVGASGAKPKMIVERTVKPQTLEVIQLAPREVDGSPEGEYNTGSGTALTRNAYRITSSAPLIAYQFNPLSNVDVFSNDASLLVPTPALTLDSKNERGASYLVMGWPQTIATTKDPQTNFGDDLRAFLTIVGTRDNTKVSVRLSTRIIGDGKKIPAKKKGDDLDVTLDAFEVLNLETGGFGPDGDFTGTRVNADKPVVIYSGSEASDVPDPKTLSSRRCCADHLEQQLFPLSTFGRTFIALNTPSRTKTLADAGAKIKAREEKEYFRVLAAGEFVTISTNLPETKRSKTIGRGQFMRIEADRDFTIEASAAVAVGQFVAGQQEVGIPSSLPGGDPSFILLPPVEQFRKKYLFLTPDKYAFDFVMIAAPKGAELRLDGRRLVAGCDEKTGKKLCCTVSTVGKVKVGNEDEKVEFQAVKCQLSFARVISGQTPPKNLIAGSQNDGVHRLVADQPVGLVVYGFDAYVSYGYPGGTDLTLINVK